MSNLPMGAENDSNAPYNEPLEVTFKAEVSFSLDGELKIEAPRDTPIELIEKQVKDNLELFAKNNNLILTESTVVDITEI